MTRNLCEERSMDINNTALKKRKREDVYEEQSGENMTIVSKNKDKGRYLPWERGNHRDKCFRN